MSDHSLSLKDSSGIIFASCLSLCLCSSAVLGDDVTDILSMSETSSLSAANEASKMIDNFRNNDPQGLSTPERKVDSSHIESQNKDTDVNESGRKTQSNQSLGLSSFKSPPSASARKYPKQEELKDIHLPHEGKKNCKDNTAQDSAKCSSSLLQGLEKTRASKSSSGVQLLIFVSQSVPADSLKDLWNQAHKIGGKLVFRGLVEGSFKETQKFIYELGIIADIDPTKFEEFEVAQVPAFVLSNESKHDKLVGNVSLAAFLEQSSATGECKEEATKLYNNLQEGES